MIPVKILREEFIIPGLKQLDMHSDAAVELLVMTAAQESHMGHWLKQMQGPALGLYQMEPATHDDIWKNYLSRKKSLILILKDFMLPSSTPETQLLGNFAYATAMARLHYWRVSEPLPKASDPEGLAGYWKKHYNTSSGKGTVEECLRAYERYK
jgi:hypothetical protein